VISKLEVVIVVVAEVGVVEMMMVIVFTKIEDNYSD